MSSRGNGLADRPGGLRGPEAAESASAARGTAPQVAPGTVPIRVLVFERSRLVAAAVGGLLAASPAIDVVGWLADPDLLLAQARECRPEVLVAWCVPGDDPADRVRQMRAALPATSILVIVAAVSHEAVRGCVEAGASGCIADECSPAELIEAISQVHAGGVLFPANLLLALLSNTPPPGEGQGGPSAVARVSARELAVLRAFATGRSTEEVAHDLVITPHTVRAHLRNAIVKLEVRSKLAAIMACLEAGAISFPSRNGDRHA